MSLIFNVYFDSHGKSLLRDGGWSSSYFATAVVFSAEKSLQSVKVRKSYSSSLIGVCARSSLRFIWGGEARLFATASVEYLAWGPT